MTDMTAATVTTTDTQDAPRYLEPGWFTRNVFNRLMVRLAKWGVSVWGSRQLAVRGRTSGEWKATPVNPLDFEDKAAPLRRVVASGLYGPADACAPPREDAVERSIALDAKSAMLEARHAAMAPRRADTASASPAPNR